MHIKQIYLYAIGCCIILSLSACGNESDKEDFDGVGKLISSRNSARYKKAEKLKNKSVKKPPVKVQEKDQDEDQNKEAVENQKEKKPEKEKLSAQIFYEEEIKIISASSNTTLGIGTAYLNKEGKIVQIKIKRD